MECRDKQQPRHRLLPNEALPGSGGEFQRGDQDDAWLCGSAFQSRAHLRRLERSKRGAGRVQPFEAIGSEAGGSILSEVHQEIVRENRWPKPVTPLDLRQQVACGLSPSGFFEEGILRWTKNMPLVREWLRRYYFSPSSRLVFKSDLPSQATRRIQSSFRNRLLQDWPRETISRSPLMVWALTPVRQF